MKTLLSLSNLYKLLQDSLIFEASIISLPLGLLNGDYRIYLTCLLKVVSHQLTNL